MKKTEFQDFSRTKSDFSTTQVYTITLTFISQKQLETTFSISFKIDKKNRAGRSISTCSKKCNLIIRL